MNELAQTRSITEKMIACRKAIAPDTDVSGYVYVLSAADFARFLASPSGKAHPYRLTGICTGYSFMGAAIYENPELCKCVLFVPMDTFVAMLMPGECRPVSPNYTIRISDGLMKILQEQD